MTRQIRRAPLAACVLGVAVAAQGPVWHRKPPAAPTASEFAMTYDAVRDRLVWFGGTGRETWEWNGLDWARLTPRTAPPTGNAFSAYDRARQRVLLVTNQPVPETWEWDGRDWRQRAVSAPARPLGPLAYDRARRVVLLVGGDSSGSAVETWGWDGSRWTPLSSSGPSPRRDFGLAYDRPRDRTVLYGGSNAAGVARAETWEWDGAVWLLRTPAVRPPPRDKVRLVCDETRQSILLLGGSYEGSSAPSARTWEWDGQSWSELAPMPHPDNRYPPSVVWHDARQSVILYGGVRLRREFFLELYLWTELPDDLWEWKSGGWAPLSGASPHNGNRRVMAEHASRGRLVLFGGDNRFEPVATALGDTYEWDGVRWQQLHPATAPSPRSGHAMVGDGTRVVLFGGGQRNDTWTFDGTTWTEVFPAQSPPGRSGHAIAWDAARQRIVLFGGGGRSGWLSDTWTFDGATWTAHATPTAPEARGHHAMVYDAARQRVVLFGGFSSTSRRLDDTWTWNGSTWVRESPAARPSGRSRHSMAYDPRRRRVVLFGGRTGTGSASDTWEWDGAEWTETSPVPAPSFPGDDHEMVYDSARGATVLFSIYDAYSGWGLFHETWTYGVAPGAAVVAYGRGCEGSRGLPSLDGFGLPVLGRAAFGLDLHRGRPEAAAAIVLGMGTGQIPVTGSCTFLVDPTMPTVTVPLRTSAVGSTSLALPIPPSPALRGVMLAAQGFVLDPVARLGVSFTGGLMVTVGE